MQENLIEGALLDWLEEDRRDRILYVEPDDRGVILFDVEGEKALPVRKKRRDVLTALRNGKARILDFDSHLPLSFSDIKSEHRKRQKKLWKVIGPLVSDEDRKILYKRSRNKLIEAATVRAREEDLPGKSKPYIYKMLRRYWRGGQVPNALLPHYQNSGAPGEVREAGEEKRGRPSDISRAEGRPTGVNVDKTTHALIRRALKKFYYTDDGYSLYDTYLLMMSRDFGVELRLKDGVQVPIFDQNKEYLNYNQFWYWFNKERNPEKEIATRWGQHELDTNHRPLKSDSNERAYGPGSVYQIDATPFDFWLVSSIDRSPIGRPVLYFIIDVFSRTITGFALNFEGPSWYGAALALYNMSEDKVQYCEKYGRTIIEADWPTRQFPRRLVADGGELAGKNATNLTSLGVNLIIAPPGRCDFKGIVEQKFGICNEKNRKWIKGSIPKKRRYGDKASELDGVYTLEEFRGVLVDIILHYNSKHELKDYKLTRGMMRDGVLPIPKEIWRWGIQNRSGHLKTFGDDYVRKVLLPRDTASISRKGLQYKGQKYVPDMDIDILQIQASLKGRKSVKVAYDPTKTSNVIYYVANDGKTFIPCHLDAFSPYYDQEYFELEYHEKMKTIGRKKRANAKLQNDAELNARLHHRDAEAEAKTAAAREGKSKSELLAGKGERRSQERQLERDVSHHENSTPDNETHEGVEEEDLARPAYSLPVPDGLDKE